MLLCFLNDIQFYLLKNTAISIHTPRSSALNKTFDSTRLSSAECENVLCYKLSDIFTNFIIKFKCNLLHLQHSPYNVQEITSA